MTINAAGFYAAALLVVAAALACVTLPSPRHAVAAGLAVLIATAVLLAVSGAYALALAELVVPAGAGAVVWAQARHRRTELVAGPDGFIRLWPVGGGVALAASALLITAFLTHSGEWAAAGGGGDSLLTVLHWDEPVGAIAAAVLTVLGIAGVLFISLESKDEKAHDAAAEDRRRKQERIERRRADRDAARRKSGVGRA